jgi:hypothetical protein
MNTPTTESKFAVPNACVSGIPPLMASDTVWPKPAQGMDKAMTRRDSLMIFRLCNVGTGTATGALKQHNFQAGTPITIVRISYCFVGVRKIILRFFGFDRG